MAKAHDVHAMHEDTVIFPALERFFPGQVCVCLSVCLSVCAIFIILFGVFYCVLSRVFSLAFPPCSPLARSIYIYFPPFGMWSSSFLLQLAQRYASDMMHTYARWFQYSFPCLGCTMCSNCIVYEYRILLCFVLLYSPELSFSLPEGLGPVR